MQVVATKENPDNRHNESYEGIHDDEQRAWRTGCLIGYRGMTDDGIDGRIGTDECLGILLLLRQGVVGIVLDLELILQNVAFDDDLLLEHRDIGICEVGGCQLCLQIFLARFIDEFRGVVVVKTRLLGTIVGDVGLQFLLHGVGHCTRNQGVVVAHGDTDQTIILRNFAHDVACHQIKDVFEPCGEETCVGQRVSNADLLDFLVVTAKTANPL